jgi:hypothetical protein
MNKTSLAEKFALIHEHWRPKVVAELNGQELKLVKCAGVFPWHILRNELEKDERRQAGAQKVINTALQVIKEHVRSGSSMHSSPENTEDDVR